MKDFLEQVVASRRAYVAQARRTHPEEELLAALPHNAWTRIQSTSASARIPRGVQPNAFTASLNTRRMEGRLAVIAELKRVSPAIGRIVADVNVEAQVVAYTS